MDTSEENPKSEYRNPKQIPKVAKGKAANGFGSVLNLANCIFGFVSGFGFRI